MELKKRMFLKVLGGLPLLLLLSPGKSCEAFISGTRSSKGVVAFSSAPQSQQQSQFMGRGMRLVSSRSNSSRQGKKYRRVARRTELGMFLGTEGGILGVGAPEVVSW